MHPLLRFLTCIVSAAGLLSAQPAAVDATPPKAKPVEAATKEDDGVRVSVLGYHDFSNKLKETEMRINTDKFRRQMQVLKDQGITVISMADFQAWKRGEKKLPPRCAVITIDDGWLSVYTDAYPILKQFGYPFTVFLYTRYIDVGGKSMTSKMIKEMQANGGTVGCHSHSHPYPGTVRSQQRRGPKSYLEFLDKEILQSKKTLEQKFGQSVNTYCYPGGFHTNEMFDFAFKNGYQHMFTVLPGKVKLSSKNETLPRYIILGTHDHVFALATEFPDTGVGIASATQQQTVPYPVRPQPGAVINSRTPVISADLTSVADIRPETLVMRVAGFGDVPATYDTASKTITWQVNRRLRSESCQVSIEWKNKAGKTVGTPLRWSFMIDREAAYQPGGE